MTREGVMALSDEELQITAARHAGFSEVGIAYVSIPWLMDICEDTLAGRIGGELVAIPDYPHDIAAAWGLWDALPVPRQVSEDAFWVEISFGIPRDDGADGFLRISKRGDQDIARAITRAFVLAMTEGK